MKLAILLALITFLARFIALPLFETIFGVFLLVPVFAYLIGQIYPLTGATYFGIMAILFGVLYLLALGRDKKQVESFDFQKEAIPVAVFCVMFWVFYSLCMRWPDFISIGERLRDFSILSSVLHSPITLFEPWMSGYPLNYYAYWYRFGHMLSTILALPTWETYHQLQSFTYALFFTCTYRIFQKHWGFSHVTALFCAIFIAFGSNVQGIISYLTLENGWWGPSRVIPGAINEFPAWSFLLGDLHPHYLNLPLIPYFILAALTAAPYAETCAQKILASLVFGTIPFLWIYNANVWEVPVWGTCLGSLALVALGYKWAGCSVCEAEKGVKDVLVDLFRPKGLLIIAFMVAANFALYLSSRHIVAPHYPVTFVQDPVARTSVADMFRHWGFPLLVIAYSLLRLGDGLTLRISGLVFGISYVWFQDVLPLLLLVLALDLQRIYRIVRTAAAEGKAPTLPVMVMEALGIVSLVLILTPEFIFLNDPYGGEIERMNTIFKLYSSNWFMIHSFAFYIFAQTFYSRREEVEKEPDLRYLGLALVLICFCAFFFRTVGMRVQSDFFVEPKEQGLSQISREFPGAGAAIKALHNMEPGVVLEAQGNAYSYTSHVSTLSEQESYLGWSNHVNLLLSTEQAEVAKREKFSEDFYKEADCAKRLEMLRQNPVKIRYIIVGPLEKQRYPDLGKTSFECLKKLISEQEYNIYTY